MYDKHGGSFIVNGHRVKLYHDEEQLNELTIEEIHLMCEEGRMNAIPFMASFPANYRKTMPWASEKYYIYSVVENTCNEAKLSDLDKTGKGIVIENIFVIAAKYRKTRKEETNMQRLSQIRRIPCQDQVRKHLKEEESNYSSFQDLRSTCNEDMVKYEGPWPSTTQARALNEKSNKKTPLANSLPPDRRVCRLGGWIAAQTEALPPGSWSIHFSFHSRRNLDNEEGSRPSKLTLDTPLDPGTNIKQ
ncbi:hypothetical protein Tco_0294473 [Tanacetum coccineum]